MNDTTEKQKTADIKAQEMLQAYFDITWEEHKDFFGALVAARMTIEAMYGIETPHSVWDRIADAYAAKVIEQKKGK